MQKSSSRKKSFPKIILNCKTCLTRRFDLPHVSVKGDATLIFASFCQCPDYPGRYFPVFPTTLPSVETGAMTSSSLMGIVMNTKILLIVLSFFPCLSGCAHAGKPESDRELRRMGLVIEDKLYPGAKQKGGVQGLSDTGRQLFAHALLTSTGGGTSSFGNAPFPRWVDVTWREGSFIQRYDPATHSAWTGGTVVGSYRVEVLSRIPKEVFEYVHSGRGAIRLQFRIKDDGVLLAWDVQESVTHPQGGSGFVYSMHGGDFPCETSPYQTHPNCTDGPLEKAP
jgi:hypothetical protein